jgi:hypothetical protein
VFTDIPGTISVEATSYKAKVTYASAEEIPGVTVSELGLLEFTLDTPGCNIVPVNETACAKEGAEAVTRGLVKPVTRREFALWGLQAIDTRTAESILSDTAQSLVDAAPSPEHPEPLAYAADQLEIDKYCDVRALVYAAGIGAGAVAGPGADPSATLKLGGVSVLKHTVSALRIT